MPVKRKMSEMHDHGVDRLMARNPNSHIVDQLRAYYSSIEEEAVPERLLKLLERLEEVETAAIRESVG